MSASVSTVPRRFRAGLSVLDDVDPTLPPEGVVALYARAYPALAGATVDENPALVDGVLEYTVRVADVQTKGARRPEPKSERAQRERVLAALRQWAETQVEPAQHRGTSLDRLHASLTRMLQRPVGQIDPFMIPMIG